MASEEIDDCVLRHLKQAFVSRCEGLEQQWWSNCQEDKESPQHPSPSHRAPLGPQQTLCKSCEDKKNKNKKCTEWLCGPLTVVWACAVRLFVFVFHMTWHIYLYFLHRDFILFWVCLACWHCWWVYNLNILHDLILRTFVYQVFIRWDWLVHM